MSAGNECFGKETDKENWGCRRAGALAVLQKGVSSRKSREVPGLWEYAHWQKGSSLEGWIWGRHCTGLNMGLEPLGTKFQHLKDPDYDGERGSRWLLSALQTPHTAGRGMATVGSSEAGGLKQSPSQGFLEGFRILLSVKYWAINSYEHTLIYIFKQFFWLLCWESTVGRLRSES